MTEYYRVFTNAFADYLACQGFEFKIVPSLREEGKLNWAFPKTPELMKAVEQYLARGKWNGKKEC